MDADVVVVGAGLAGLAAACTLRAAGREVVVLEAADAPGGRVRSAQVAGCTVDRGFQVVLTAYPELSRQLDVDALDLRRFDPGVVVRVGDRFHRVGDPLRMPLTIGSDLMAPVGTIADKARLARWALALRRADARSLLRGPDEPVGATLERLGFSRVIIDRLFTPLLGGILLDPALTVSCRFAEVVLRCLLVGWAAVPAGGMQAIPDQLAGRLPPGSLHLGTAAAQVSAHGVRLADGDVLRAQAVVVATDGPAAAELLGIPNPGSLPASCAWFAAPEPPTGDRLLVLDGNQHGPARNVAVMTNVAPQYGTGGTAVIAAACPGTADRNLEQPVRVQLREWWGPAVEAWTHLRTDVIHHAHPLQRPPFTPRRSVRLQSGVFLCGDHRDTASIQGALFSGRRCATEVLRWSR